MPVTGRRFAEVEKIDRETADMEKEEDFEVASTTKGEDVNLLKAMNSKGTVTLQEKQTNLNPHACFRLQTLSAKDFKTVMTMKAERTKGARGKAKYNYTITLNGIQPHPIGHGHTITSSVAFSARSTRPDRKEGPNTLDTCKNEGRRCTYSKNFKKDETAHAEYYSLGEPGVFHLLHLELTPDSSQVPAEFAGNLVKTFGLQGSELSSALQNAIGLQASKHWDENPQSGLIAVLTGALYDDPKLHKPKVDLLELTFKWTKDDTQGNVIWENRRNAIDRCKEVDTIGEFIKSLKWTLHGLGEGQILLQPEPWKANNAIVFKENQLGEFMDADLGSNAVLANDTIVPLSIRHRILGFNTEMKIIIDNRDVSCTFMSNGEGDQFEVKASITFVARRANPSFSFNHFDLELLPPETSDPHENVRKIVEVFGLFFDRFPAESQQPIGVLSGDFLVERGDLTFTNLEFKILDNVFKIYHEAGQGRFDPDLYREDF